MAERSFGSFQPGWAIVEGTVVRNRDERVVRRRIMELDHLWKAANDWWTRSLLGR
jgi:hypothetical protein